MTALVRKVMGAGVAAGLANVLLGDVQDSLTASGSSQSDAQTIGAAISRFTTVASNSGAILPAGAIGDECMVINAGANTLSVYPPSGHAINAQSSNEAFSIATATSMTFKRVSNTLWLTNNRALPPLVKLGWTTGNPAVWGRDTNVYNSTNDEVVVFGYNLSQDGTSIPDTSDSSVGVFFESNYNDGSARYAEWHVDMAGPNQSYKRPFYVDYALSGANANNVTQVTVLSDVAMLLSASATGTITMTAQTFTVGTSGASFNMTGNITASGRVLLGSVTDTDSSSYLQLGAGDNAAGSRSSILFRVGGYANPSNANAASNGDKLVLYNNSTEKAAIGLDTNGQVFLQQHRPSGSAANCGFRFVGGLGTNSADLASLDSIGSFLACAGTAIPAGGTAGAGLKVSSTSNFGVFFGSGAPSLSAAQGSLYLRSDGTTTNDRMYVNTNGTTGWTAVITAT